MKLTIAALLAFACSAFAQLDTVTLAWNPSPSPGIREYSLYFSQSTNEWTHVKNTGLELQATVGLATLGRWYFVAVATDTNGVTSDPSNMVSYDVLPGPTGPSGMRIMSAVVTRVSTVVTSPNLITVP